MKYLSIILICVLFVSCNQEELQKQNETYFIDLIKNQIELNDEMILKVFFKVEKAGSKRVDVKVYQEMLALKTGRNKLIKGTLLNNFDYLNDTLISEYQSFINKICEENDSFAVMDIVKQELIPIQEFNQIKKASSKFEKIIWVYHCLYLEGILLERYTTMVGSPSYYNRRNNSFSNTKNTSLGNTFEMIFIPPEENKKDNRGIQIIYKDFTFLIDSVETEIDYDFEQIRFMGVLSFIPPKKGVYRVLGESHLKVPKSFGFKKSTCCEARLYYQFEVN